MVYGQRASDTSPFPFNASTLNKVGYADRLFTNVLLMPSLMKSKFVKGGPGSAMPKAVVDTDQQLPYTWMNVMLNFTELHTSKVVLNIGSSVGVCFWVSYI